MNKLTSNFNPDLHSFGKFDPKDCRPGYNKSAPSTDLPSRKFPGGFYLCFFTVFMTALGLPLRAADLQLASYFSDHMVLQRDQPICVWGTSAAHAVIQVKLGSDSTETTAASDGHWQVFLKPLPAGGPDLLQASSAGSTVKLDDVLMGDVWLCSGQSNMQMPVKECASAEQAATLAYRPELRLCSVGKGWNAKPQFSADIKWQTGTPDSERNFSAVAYFFACELLKDDAFTNVPIGVIDSSFGGTTCEGWIPQTALAGFDSKDLHDSMFGIKPSMLYNAMIAPLGQTGLKGVIWYQGESNSGHPDTYPQLLSTMIAQWRQQFDRSELPFFIIQLPDYASQWDGFYWPWEREAQAQVAKTIPDTALVVGIETTDGFDLHPKQKLEIGRRTALRVRHDVYQESIVAQGPVFRQATIESSAIRVKFDTGGDGLASSSTNGVDGFAVAGDDGGYRFAQARIDGDSVIVHCDQVPRPKTVRYAWTGVPHSTLINRAGLPAAPFRTDDFPPANIEVQLQPVSRHVTTAAYEVTVDGDGRVTSLVVQGVQFISNAPGMSGATSIPVMFGNRSLAEIDELGPDLLSCRDADLIFLLHFDEYSMSWTFTNLGKDKMQFNIAVSPLVKISQAGNSETVSLGCRNVSFDITGIGSVSGPSDGQVLRLDIPGKSSKEIQFQMGRAD